MGWLASVALALLVGLAGGPAHPRRSAARNPDQLAEDAPHARWRRGRHAGGDRRHVRRADGRPAGDRGSALRRGVRRRPDRAHRRRQPPLAAAESAVAGRRRRPHVNPERMEAARSRRSAAPSRFAWPAPASLPQLGRPSSSSSGDLRSVAYNFNSSFSRFADRFHAKEMQGVEYGEFAEALPIAGQRDRPGQFAQNQGGRCKRQGRRDRQFGPVRRRHRTLPASALRSRPLYYNSWTRMRQTYNTAPSRQAITGVL